MSDLPALPNAQFGKGFLAQSLWSYRQFYLEFPILSTTWRELHWSHFRMLMCIKDPVARSWYTDEAAVQDVGKMDMYVRVFDEQRRTESDNPTLGLILCSERNAAVATYSQLADNPQLFASKYQRLIPTEAELRAELEMDRALLESAKMRDET